VPAKNSSIKRAEASDLSERSIPQEQPARMRPQGRSKQSRVELVLEAVKTRLANGTWNPGDRLPNEDELATLLDVSRTPLREAIKILDAAGVLELRRGTGTFVRSGPVASLSQLVLFQRYLSRATPQSLMEVRWLFERSCAELAAQRRTREDLAAMRAAIRDLRQLCTADWRDVVAEICEADKQFHRCIYASGKNELIATIANFVLDMVSPFMTRSLQVGGPFDTIQLHEMLYTMIETGNPGGAREITSMNAVDINLNHFRENLEAPMEDDASDI
jgi:GntR family transcriptional repressor for pyruvate dehydrogenase complex